MEIINKIKAGYPLLYVRTYEEDRFIVDFVKALEQIPTIVTYVWDIHRGLNVIGKQNTDTERRTDPIDVLTWYQSDSTTDSILILKDFHPYIDRNYRDHDIIIRIIKNSINKFKAVGKFIIIISPVLKIPVEIEKEISVIEYNLPNREDLKKVLKLICESASVPYPTDKEESIINALLGLTFFEAENALSISLVKSKQFDTDIIIKEKSSIVKKTNLLELVEVNQTLDDVGGLELLKQWLISRKKCFSEEAKKFGIVNPPKGLLLVGTPGCGKSLVAKVISRVWERPLLRLDMGNVFGSYVGESEANINKALSTAEAVSPCILWIDEIEKDLAGNKAGHEGHEVTRKVFKILLTWLQERKADVFLVATANAVESIPPELLRAGRIDAIYWVDLPSYEQRKEIISIHLRKVNRDPFRFDIDKLAQLSQGFSGAEIECWVKEALIIAFDRKHEDIEINDFQDALKEITPISVLMKEDIERSREWARKRKCKNASIIDSSLSLNEITPKRKLNNK